MRRYLGGSRSIKSLCPKMVFDLFAARAGCFKIILRVAFDFRLSVFA
jgi:hypothetical protein